MIDQDRARSRAADEIGYGSVAHPEYQRSLAAKFRRDLERESSLSNARSSSMQPAGEWIDRSACIGKTDVMFPNVGEKWSSRPPQEWTDRTYGAALAICRSCPVLKECAEWIIATEPASVRHGVVGGLTPGQRDTEYRKRQRVAS